MANSPASGGEFNRPQVANSPARATLLYDERRVAEHAVETVGWTVKEFALVHSLYGRARYVQLGRWPLRG